MATKKGPQVKGYGIGDNLIDLAPLPVKAKRNPTDKDHAPLGTPWVNEKNQSSYMVSDISASKATWNSIGGIGGTATAASPTAAVTINEKSFKAVFTGFTTAAAGGTQQFTINNNKHTSTTDAISLSVSTNDTDDARISIRDIHQNNVGQIVVTIVNNGAASTANDLNGDVIITGEIKS